MAEDIPKLFFRPSQDEHLYLESKGVLKNWSKQCHSWIARDIKESMDQFSVDRKQSRLDTLDRVRNGLLIMGVGILVFIVAQGAVLMSPAVYLVITGSAVASVIIGIITIFYRKRRKNGRSAADDKSGH